MNMEITSIRYINMDKNWHRKLFMTLLLRSLPFKNFRYSGVRFDFKNNAYDKYLKYGFDPHLELINKDRITGVIGCWIAHSIVLEDVTEQNGITVVLEDDFVCRSHFFEKALSMVNSFNRDFDIVVFDTWGTGPLEIHKIYENIYSPRHYSYPYYGGTHCLFVNNARIPKILEAKINSQVLDYDGFLLTGGKLDTYIFYTGDCASRAIGSDITTRQRSNYDLWGVFICSLPHALRERTRKFNRYFSKPIGIKTGILSEKELKGFEGYYQYQEQKKINIKFAVKDGWLVLLQPWGQAELLFQPISDVDFISQESSIPLKFAKDEKGDVISALFNNKDLWQKNNNYKEDSRKQIEFSLEMLKKFEGIYHSTKGDRIIQITAKDGCLLSKQLWLGTETYFSPVSELEFLDRNYPLFSLRFIQNTDGAIAQVEGFFGLDIFTK